MKSLPDRFLKGFVFANMDATSNFRNELMLPVNNDHYLKEEDRYTLQDMLSVGFYEEPSFHTEMLAFCDRKCSIQLRSWINDIFFFDSQDYECEMQVYSIIRDYQRHQSIIEDHRRIEFASYCEMLKIPRMESLGLKYNSLIITPYDTNASLYVYGEPFDDLTLDVMFQDKVTLMASYLRTQVVCGLLVDHGYEPIFCSFVKRSYPMVRPDILSFVAGQKGLVRNTAREPLR